jgi:hypothetical protein
LVFVGSSQFLIVPLLPQKIQQATNVVKSDLKIIILLFWPTLRLCNKYTDYKWGGFNLKYGNLENGELENVFVSKIGTTASSKECDGKLEFNLKIPHMQCSCSSTERLAGLVRYVHTGGSRYPRSFYLQICLYTNVKLA